MHLEPKAQQASQLQTASAADTSTVGSAALQDIDLSTSSAKLLTRMPVDLRPVALAAGAAAVVGVLFFLLREEEEEDRETAKDPGSGKGLLHQVLTELVQIEERAKRAVDEMVREQLAGEELSIDEAYKRVEELDLYDPLEKQGLSIQDFEMLVTDSQQDPFVMESMARLSGTSMDRPPPDLTLEQIIELKGASVEELHRLAEQFPADGRDFKAATVALKALVHAKVEKQHKVPVEDVEAAAMVKQAELFNSADFLEILKKQQQAMQSLLSKTSPPGGEDVD